LSGTNFVTDSFFTPYNWQNLNAADQDLGSAGIVLTPGTNLALSGGKGETFYVVNKDTMGGVGNISPTNPLDSNYNIVQNFNAKGMVYGGPVWWDGPNASWTYFIANVPQFGTASLYQYEFDTTAGMPSLTNVISKPANYFGILAISSNGTNAGTGILWQSGENGANGILTAYNAQNISTQLYSSESNHGRDFVGDYATFSSPTVANGKVYLATFSNRLDVYGLLPPSLTANITDGDVVLSWPTNNYPNYVLQTSPDLFPGNWRSTVGDPIITNSLYQVSDPASETASFFRLEL
jgi:hypothetical protein